MKATRSFIRRFFGALVSLNVFIQADHGSCPYAQTYVPKSGYGVDANAWLARHIRQNVTDGMSAVITQLESLQGRVADCADPVEVTDCILRAVGLDADEREGGLSLDMRKALRTACFAAQFFTHGAIGVCAETMIVGGQFCVPGTHMRACETHYALMRHPSVIEKMGVELTRKECAAMCLLAQMTCVCRDAIDMPFSESMRRARRRRYQRRHREDAGRFHVNSRRSLPEQPQVAVRRTALRDVPARARGQRRRPHPDRGGLGAARGQPARRLLDDVL